MAEIEAQIDTLAKALIRHEDGYSMIELRLEDEIMCWRCACCEESWVMGTKELHDTDCVVGQARKILKDRGMYD